MDDADLGMLPRRNAHTPHQFQLCVSQVALHLLHQQKQLGVELDTFAPLLFLLRPQSPGSLAVGLELSLDFTGIQAVFQIDPLILGGLFTAGGGGERCRFCQDATGAQRLACYPLLEPGLDLRRALELDPQPQQRAERHRWPGLVQTLEPKPDFIFIAHVNIQADTR